MNEKGMVKPGTVFQGGDLHNNPPLGGDLSNNLPLVKLLEKFFFSLHFTWILLFFFKLS